MFALPQFYAPAPLRRVNADIPGGDYVEAGAPRVQPARLVGPWICAPEAPKPYCTWEVSKTGGEGRRSPDWLRAA